MGREGVARFGAPFGAAGDARLLSKTSVWMQNTQTGDRAEISRRRCENVSQFSEIRWNRILEFFGQNLSVTNLKIVELLHVIS